MTAVIDGSDDQFIAKVPVHDTNGKYAVAAFCIDGQVGQTLSSGSAREMS